MERNVKISILCQIYEKMLTEKQFEFLNDYYNNDFSLSEIAENNGITRQAVRDAIKQGENKLFELEEKLEFMKKTQTQEKQIKEIIKKIENIEKKENISLENIKSDIEKLV